MARALAGGAEQIPTAPSAASFPDVPVGSRASRYVEYAAAQHVVQGYPDGQFAPDLVVDRAQMAAFVARASADPLGEAGLASYAPPTTATFPDAPVDF